MHVEVTGLSPDRWYAYRFRVGTWVSPVGPHPHRPADRRRRSSRCAWRSARASAGRPATTPPTPTWWRSAPTSSCGRVTTSTPRVTATVARAVAGGEATDIGRVPQPLRGVPVRPGPAGRARRLPLAGLWDDHEVEDNYAGIVPSDGTPDDDPAGFAARRDAAYRAWWEHMPVRLPPPAAGGSPTYRSLRWGRLAQFAVLDGRQHRSDQPCGDGFVRSCPERDSPDATMLGAEQEAWVAAGFAEAAATGVGWTVLVNPVAVDRPVGPARRRCGPGEHGRLGRLPTGTPAPSRRRPGGGRAEPGGPHGRHALLDRGGPRAGRHGRRQRVPGARHLLALPEGPGPRVGPGALRAAPR